MFRERVNMLITTTNKISGLIPQENTNCSICKVHKCQCLTASFTSCANYNNKSHTFSHKSLSFSCDEMRFWLDLYICGLEPGSQAPSFVIGQKYCTEGTRASKTFRLAVARHFRFEVGQRIPLKWKLQRRAWAQPWCLWNFAVLLFEGLCSFAPGFNWVSEFNWKLF